MKKTDYTKSTGQGNLFTQFDRKIFENDTCIISRLQSSSLTGRNPQIKVHRHFRNRLHLIWQAKTKCSQPDLSGTADIKFKLKNSLQTSYSVDRKIDVIA
jgi:hypothetical protein